MNKKIVIPVIVVLVLIALGVAFHGAGPGDVATSTVQNASSTIDIATSTTTASSSVPAVTAPVAGTPRVFTSTQYGIAVTYPGGFTPIPNHTYALRQGEELQGVAFKVPASFTSGTNLNEDSYMSFEFPKGTRCDAPSFLQDDDVQEHKSVKDQGLTWDYARSTGVGAGNLYEETVYAVSRGGQCYVARLFVHSGNIGNYPAGTVRAFDKDALLAAFAGFRASLKFL